MAFCSKCGKEIPEGSTLCGACEAAEKIGALNNTPDATAEYDPADIQKNKGLSVLAYLGILILIPLFASKGSKFARFHINQGLVLIIADLALYVALKLLGIVFGLLGSLGGIILSVLSTVGELGILVLMILGIVNAAKGAAKQLPIIGGINILK